MNIISLDWPYCSEPCQIVRVSGAVHQMGPEKAPRPEVLVPGVWNTSTVVIRSSGDVAALGPLIRKEVAALDRQQPISKMETMTASLAGTTEQRRFGLALTGSFTALALVLAGLGIFAVAAFGVSQRTRELAVRLAVGAGSGHVISEVLRQCLLGLIGGAAAGLPIAVPVMSSLRGYLFNVARTLGRHIRKLR